MKDFGFFRVAAVSPLVKPTDVQYNLDRIVEQVDLADSRGASLVVLPELSITGYTCGDLFAQKLLLDKAEQAIAALATRSLGWNATVLAGVPVSFRGRLYNCAAVISHGALHGLVPKIYLPTYNEFYESRWFSSGRDFMPEGSTITYAGLRGSLDPSAAVFISCPLRCERYCKPFCK